VYIKYTLFRSNESGKAHVHVYNNMHKLNKNNNHNKTTAQKLKYVIAIFIEFL